MKAYKINDSNAPSFPANFKVLKHKLLQKTELGIGKEGTNHNKFYSLELHEAAGAFRIYTHYGRTGEDGTHEARFPSTESEARKEFDRIFREKTKGGYKELSVASCKVGSEAVRGKPVGEIDAATRARIEGGDKPQVKKAAAPSTLASAVRELVSTLYSEATGALLESKIDASITAQGVETPLGVLTLAQVEKGEELLKQIHKLMKYGEEAPLTRLTGEYLTAIPHKVGRSRAGMSAAVIRTPEQIAEEQDNLELMRDMLVVSSGDSTTLASDDVDQKYLALGCRIEEVPASAFGELRNFVLKSQVRGRIKDIARIFTLHRAGEEPVFERSVGNVQKLFHGSRAKNWMGILSRGILLPKVVQTLGVSRTDGGWLGDGIYFGSEACTPVYYTSPTKKGSRYMAVAEVALGKPAKFTKITYGLKSPPPGHDSCHGVRGTAFSDNELVVYRQTQQRLAYLVEFK